MIRGAIIFALVATAIVPSATTAWAHPLVDRGVSAYEDAEFSLALQHFADAEESDALTRADVESLLLHRSLCHYALGDEDAFRRELEKLARLTPSFALGPTLPPRVRDAFAELVAGESSLSLTVETLRAPEGVKVIARIVGDPGGLVRGVRVMGRREGGDWITSRRAEVLVPASPGESIRYRAELFGPGGAILRAEEGISERAAIEEQRSSLELDREAGAVESGGPPWGWIALGVGLVAAAAVVVAILVATAETNTRFGPPELR